jgi:hypothetical protein
MRTLRNFTLLITVLLFVTESSAFALKTPLRTESANPSDVSGVFTLILYGANYSDDLETVALLDNEGDGYTFEPFAPQFNYKIKKGIQAQDALKEAEQFVSFHNAFWKYHLSKILNPEGIPIGYEVKPLYRPFVYGFSDILDIYYWLKGDGKVKVVIKLDNVIDNTRIPGGDSPSHGGE